MLRRLLSLCLLTGSLLFVVGTDRLTADDSKPAEAKTEQQSAETKPDISRVLPAGQLPKDVRLQPHRKLTDGYHGWVPPTTKKAWEAEAVRIREQVLVSNGLWPKPPVTPLEPVIHGRIDRDDYTIEKVSFASIPGHYVTGNLYRPKKTDGKAPGVLCPHGHWRNGRFYDAGDEGAKSQLDQGAEKFDSGAHFPVQARMVHLARMGCVVFHYDMAGYADSQKLVHRAGFQDLEAELRLQNMMGIQTWNSVRALDFLMSLPDVDVERIGVTGSSGGGTQTFMLTAIDPRPHIAFPAVMVSTAMQGGCVCENASYLRIGINNVALAALFAPKPMAMSGADDWTINIETKGLPELKQIYGLYDKPDYVQAKAYPEFKHNYNQVAREMMYAWFNKQLGLGLEEPVVERDFTPVSVAELSVYDESHPVPEDAVDAVGVRKYLTKIADAQLEALLPKNESGIADYQRLIGTAAHVILDRGVPAAEEIAFSEPVELQLGEVAMLKTTISRVDSGTEVPVVALVPQDFEGTAVLWVMPEGKKGLFTEAGEPTEAVKKLLAAKLAVVAPDVFLTGEFVAEGKEAEYQVDPGFAGFTYGYNRPLVAERVRDILTVTGALVKHDRVHRIHLLGTGDAGVWALLARSLAGEHVTRTIVDVNGFSFGKIKSTNDPNMLPGALKYGGIGGFAALAAPAELTIAGVMGTLPEEWKPLHAVYQAANAKVNFLTPPLTTEMAVDLLLK